MTYRQKFEEEKETENDEKQQFEAKKKMMIENEQIKLEKQQLIKETFKSVLIDDLDLNNEEEKFDVGEGISEFLYRIF